MCLPRRFPVIWSSVLQVRRWYITSAITDYVCTEIFASSKLRRPPTTRAWRTPLYRPTIMLAFFKHGDDAYLRRPPTTHEWRAPLYRLAIILAFHVSSSTSPLTSNIWTSVLLRRRWCTISTTTDYARTEIAATLTGDHVGLLQTRWWCIPSATTGYARMESAALSTGDHIGLPRVLIHIAPHNSVWILAYTIPPLFNKHSIDIEVG